MSKLLRRTLITFAVLTVLVYAGAAAWLRINEMRLIYHPLAGPLQPIADSLHLTWQRVTVTASDGVRLVGVVVPAEDTTNPWLLFFHGNGGNVTVSRMQDLYAAFHTLGLNVLAIDYRGYGESDPRPPTEVGLYADARAAYDWLRAKREVPPQRIIIYGWSLGSGPAIELATRVPAAALVLEGAFTSIADRGAELYPWLPVRWVVTQQFANVEKIGRVGIPKLLMHARDDNVVPFAHGRRLFSAASPPKQWVELNGGHMDAHHVYWQESLGAFIRSLQTNQPVPMRSAPTSP